MGDAVSAVTGSVGGVLGGAIGGLTNGMTPKINVADQTKLNDQIARAQAMGQFSINRADSQQAAADRQLDTTRDAFSNAGAQINNANQVNQRGDVQSALGLLQSQANGTAPSAAEGVLQQGKDQAIATQMAMANSGNLSQMIGGQKTAMDNAANLVQQSANQASQLRANQQATGQQAYAGAAGQQAAQAGTNASTANVLAANQAGLYNNQLNSAIGYANAANGSQNLALGGTTSGLELQQGVGTQNAQNQVQATGGLMNAGGAALGMLASDENLKTNIQSDQASRAKGISDYFKEENKKPEPKTEEEPNSPKKFDGYGDDDPRAKAAKAIKEGFLSSDEDGKKNVKSGSMLHAFLDKLNPVTFEYKESTGDMGRTPGTHLGVLAQDVEKAPGGQSMVQETPEGKAIDLASAVGMLMSAAADSHDRVSSLEELFKNKKAGGKK